MINRFLFYLELIPFLFVLFCYLAYYELVTWWFWHTAKRVTHYFSEGEWRKKEW